MSASTSYTEQLSRKIGKWTEKVSSPEFRQFKREQLSYIIADDFERKHITREYPQEFLFSDAVEKQHSLVMSFFDLAGSNRALAQCEYYFRRFPFRDLPVSKHDHIRNVCQMYFEYFYIIKSRMKVVFERFKMIRPDVKADFGSFIKSYDKEFDQEIRARNRVNHHYSFEDLDIDRIMLTEVASSEGSGWERRHLQAYRVASKEWGRRVRQRSTVMEKFIEAIANLILDHALFL